MASPIRLGLDYKYSLNGQNSGAIFKGILLNSSTVKTGEAVTIVATGIRGYRGTAERVLGVCEGIISMKAGLEGRPIDQLTSGSDYNGTYTATLKQYEASSDNQTVDKVNLLVRVDPLAVYSMKQDGTVGTTGDSDQIGAEISFNVTTADSLDESTAVAGGTGATSKTVMGLGTDPDDSTRIMGAIVETQIPRASTADDD